VPDAFVFALLAPDCDCRRRGTYAVAPAASDDAGEGFLGVDPFTLANGAIIITARACDVAAVGRVIRELRHGDNSAQRCRDGGVLCHGEFVVQLGFSLIFSAVLAKEIARVVEGVDYRALAAAASSGSQRLGTGLERIRCAANGHAGSVERKSRDRPTTAWSGRNHSRSATRSFSGKA